MPLPTGRLASSLDSLAASFTRAAVATHVVAVAAAAANVSAVATSTGIWRVSVVDDAVWALSIPLNPRYGGISTGSKDSISIGVVLAAVLALAFGMM